MQLILPECLERQDTSLQGYQFAKIPVGEVDRCDAYKTAWWPVTGSHNLLEEFTIEQLLWLLCMPACVLYMESVLVSAVELLGDFGLWLYICSHSAFTLLVFWEIVLCCPRFLCLSLIILILARWLTTPANEFEAKTKLNRLRLNNQTNEVNLKVMKAE